MGTKLIGWLECGAAAVSVRELRSGWRFLLRKRSAIRWLTDTFSLLHTAHPPPPNRPFYYWPRIDGCPFLFPSMGGGRSVGKLDLRFPIDLWSIYEAIDRDNLSRPIVLWQSKEDSRGDEMDRRFVATIGFLEFLPWFGVFPSSHVEQA